MAVILGGIYVWIFFVILENNHKIMKRIAGVLFLIFLYVHSHAETIDSLKSKREMLYQKYSEINIPGKELSGKDLNKVIEILKDLVIIDARIIKEFGGSDKLLKDDEVKIKELNSEKETLQKEKENTADLLFLIYISGGIIVLFLLLSLVFLFVYFFKYNKTRKKMLVYAELVKDVETDRLKISKMNEVFTQKDDEIKNLGQQLQTVNNENAVMESKLKELEGQIAEIQKNQQDRAGEYNEQIEKVNINMSKIEKLGRMKELGIVTEEEFNTFKQKFLEEL